MTFSTFLFTKVILFIIYYNFNSDYQNISTFKVGHRLHKMFFFVKLKICHEPQMTFTFIELQKMNQLRQELSNTRIDQQSTVLPMPKLHHSRKPPKMIPRSYASSHPTSSMQAYHASRGLKAASSPEDGASTSSLRPLGTPSSATSNCCHVLKKSIDKIQIM